MAALAPVARASLAVRARNEILVFVFILLDSLCLLSCLFAPVVPVDGVGFHAGIDVGGTADVDFIVAGEVGPELLDAGLEHVTVGCQADDADCGLLIILLHCCMYTLLYYTDNHSLFVASMFLSGL